MTNGIRQGVELALDRLFRGAVTERIASTPEPEQLEERPLPSRKPYAKDVVPKDLGEEKPTPWWQELFLNAPSNILQNLLWGAEQAFTSAGAAITYPFRTNWEEFINMPESDYSFTTFLPGGRQYEQYEQWKTEKKDPAIPVPIPSWRQLGAWLKPLLTEEPTKSILNQFGIDASKWEEPDAFEMARWGMAETAELAPLMVFGGGLGRKPLEKAADLAAKKIAEGKTAETALNETFNVLAKKGDIGKLQKGLVPKAIKPEAPARPPLYKESPIEMPPEVIAKIEQDKVKLNDIAQRLTEGLKQVKEQRKIVEAGKRERFMPKLDEFDTLLKEAKTPEEVANAFKALGGRNLPEEIVYPLKDAVSPEDWAFLIEQINNSVAFQGKPLTAGRTILALQRAILGTGEQLQPHEIRNIAKFLGDALGEQLGRTPEGWAKFKDLFVGIINIPKAMMASFDLSATLRQGLVLTTTYPIKAARATWSGLRAVFSEKYANEVDEILRSSRFAPLREKLELTELPARGRALVKMEEAFMSNIVHKIPIIGEITRRSERAYVTTLNKLRADVFDKYAALWEGKATQREYDDLSQLINILSGRGSIGGVRLKEFVALTNNVLFSPRLQISRVQALGLPIALWKYSPAVRRVALRNIMSFLGAVGGIVGMIKYANIPGVSVETDDSTSADYGKIKVGDTRVDPWGGFQQYIKLMSRLATGEMKTASGKTIDIDRFDELVSFARMKLSPALSIIFDLIKGETVIVEEMTTEPEEVKKQTFNRFVPLFIQDFVDAMRNDGMTGAITASPGFLGVGVVSYPSKTYMNWLDAVEKATGKEWEQDAIIALRPDFNEAETSWLEYWELPTARAREYYLEANPEIEASMYFWGEKGSVTSKEAYDEFQKLRERYGVPEEIYPIKEIEPFDESDKTSDEIFYAGVELMPSYFSDYVVKNKNTFEVSPDYVRQLEEEKRTASQLTNKYYMETKGLTAKQKEKYRENNPEIDAALVIWRGLVQIHSTKALALIRAKADELGIPQDIVPALKKLSEGGKVKVVVPKKTTTKRKSFLDKVNELYGD